MLSVRELSKSFGRVQAVRGISFRLARGHVVGLLGANGAGKTTTIRMVTGFLPPDAGSVHVAGLDMARDSRGARRNIGYLPEAAPAYAEMTAAAYLHFRGRLYAMPRRARTGAIERVLERCWLRDVRDRRIGHLSKGFRQRVGLAASLLHDPPLLVLDEPTNGLDPTQIREMRRLIRELATDHTVLVSSHILPEVERTCDRVIIMARGRIMVDAKPGELLDAMRESSPYFIEVRAGTDIAAAERTLRSVPGVEDVAPRHDLGGNARDTDGWAGFTVTPAARASDLREAIASAASGHGLLIRELRRETPTLERVFLELIDAEDPSEHPAVRWQGGAVERGADGAGEETTGGAP